MLLSIVLGILICLATATAFRALSGGAIREKVVASDGTVYKKLALFRGIGEHELVIAIAAGLAIGLVNFFAGNTASVLWLGPILFTIMIAAYVALMYWWHIAGSTALEAGCFIVLAGLLYFTTKATAYATTALWTSVLWDKIVLMIPALLLITTITFVVANAFFYRADYVDARGEDKQFHRIMGRVSIAMGVIVMVIIILINIPWSTAAASTTTPVKPESRANDGKNWYAFYNLALQKDEDKDNDFNFGYNPYDESKTAKDYDKDFRERLKKDPALAAADTAWMDAKLGTRYLGEFYESCKGDWAKTINAAKLRFMDNKTAYYKNLDAYFAFLNSAVKVEVKEGYGASDQMYMNPYTADGVPDVIVMKTKDHKGHFLIYTFNIKGEKVKLAYRIECGYQPTNVSKLMKITPQKEPTPTSNNSTPNNPTNPGKPTPTNPSPTPDNPTNPTTPTSKSKDPADDPVNNGNANKGGGDNNPSDGSGEEQPNDPRNEAPNTSKTPETPTVAPDHSSDDIVDHENKMDYNTDPVTDRGPANGGTSTSSDGDGEFTPSD